MAFGAGGELVEVKIRMDTSELAANIVTLNRLLTTYVSLARSMGIEGDIIDAIAKLQRLRVAAETAYRSVMMLYTATGPLGTAVGVGGLILSGFMMAESARDVRESFGSYG